MVSEKDLNSAELEDHEDIKESDDGDDGQRRGANQRRSDVICQRIGLLVNVMLLQEPPAVLLLGKHCDEHGYTYHFKSGQNPHLIKNGEREDCKKSNYVPFVVPGISASPSSTAPSSTSPPSSSQESTPANKDSVSEKQSVESPVSERSGGTNGRYSGRPAA